MSRKVNYFESQQLAPIDNRCVLVSLNAAYIPMVLSRIETAKGRSWWINPGDWERGYTELTLFQWGLLMDCGEFLVNNIIALRGIDPAAPRDETTGVPLNPPVGTTLVDLHASLNSGGFSIADWSASIDETVNEIALTTQEGLIGEGDIAFLSTLLGII